MICVGCIVSDRKRLRKLPGGIFLRCFFLEFLSPHGVSGAEMSHFPRLKTSPRGSVPLQFRAKQPKNTSQICMYSHFLPQEPPRELFLPPIHRAILIVSENGVKIQKRGGKTTKWALFLDFRHFYATFSAHSVDTACFRAQIACVSRNAEGHFSPCAEAFLIFHRLHKKLSLFSSKAPVFPAHLPQKRRNTPYFPL